MGIVGRAAELAALRALIAATGSGHGGTVVLLGEAGIGKSRLLTAAGEDARSAGLTVLRGRAVPGGGTYRPLTAALGGRVVPPGLDSPVLYGETLLTLIGPDPAVLLLDDLHWADPDTLAVLDYLSDAVADRPVGLCLAARDDARTAEVLHRIGQRPAARTLRPARLAAAEVAALTSMTDPAGVAELTARSDGIPLLVEELAAAPDGVPRSMRSLVDSRMRSLDPEHRRLLHAAAVIGADLGWEIVARTAGTDLAGLRPATEAELLRAEDGVLTWRHALTRDAVLAGLLPHERAELAGRAATLLDDGEASEAAARAADLTPDPRAAAAIRLRLVRADLDRGALRSAREHLSHVDAAGPDRIGRAIEEVRLHTLTGEVAAALRAGADVLDSATGDEHAELCLRLARCAITAGRWAEATAYAQRAGRPEDPRVATALADAAYGAGDPDRAAALAAGAVAVASGGDLVTALLVEARCLGHTDTAAAGRSFARAGQIAAEHGLVAGRVAALIGLATVQALDVPDPPALAEARALARSAGLLAQTAQLGVLAADLTQAGTGPAAAEALAREAATLAARLRLAPVQAVAEWLTAAARAGAGDTAGTEEWLAAAARHAEGPREIVAGAPLIRALACVTTGDLRGAAVEAARGAAAVAGYRSAAPTHLWGLCVLLGVAAGDDRRRVNRGATRLASAMARARAGEPYAGELAAGDALLDGHPWWHRALRLIVWTYAVTEGWGDPVPGLRADLAWSEQHDADVLAARQRDLLRLAGAPVRRAPGVPPAQRAAGITGRESEVLTLVAGGRSNAEIAERLFLSVRTVETHVSRLLAKTGTADRRQLAAWPAAEHQ